MSDRSTASASFSPRRAGGGGGSHRLCPKRPRFPNGQHLAGPSAKATATGCSSTRRHAASLELVRTLSGDRPRQSDQSRSTAPWTGGGGRKLAEWLWRRSPIPTPSMHDSTAPSHLIANPMLSDKFAAGAQGAWADMPRALSRLALNPRRPARSRRNLAGLTAANDIGALFGTDESPAHLEKAVTALRAVPGEIARAGCDT